MPPEGYEPRKSPWTSSNFLGLFPSLRSGTPDRDDDDEVLTALKAIIRVHDQQDEPHWREIDRALNLGREAIARRERKESDVA